MTRDRYVPVLRLPWLTRFYDPLMERWPTASRIRSAVIDALELKRKVRLLELGCGPGRLAIEIKRRYPLVTIDALDADPAMIELARRNAAEAGFAISFHQADITQLPDLGTFDRVYSTLVFHHLLPEGKEAALLRAKQALKPGGRLVIADFGRPRGFHQWILSNLIHPLDGVRNTTPHRDGRFELMLRTAFGRVDSVAFWRTIFGTVELFVCTP